MESMRKLQIDGFLITVAESNDRGMGQNQKVLNLNVKLSTKIKKSKKHYQKVEMQESNEEDKMIKEEYDSLVSQRQDQIRRSELVAKNQQLWTDANYQPAKVTSSNRHNFNIYADKLLVHLVIEEEFDFDKISQIMTYTFSYEQKVYSEHVCRERWYELHRDREVVPLVRGKQQKIVKKKSQEQENTEQMVENMGSIQSASSKQLKQLNNNPHGYNIFKDSIRKIDNLQKYNQLQKQMKSALQKAAQSIQLEKPMLYTPYYDRLQQFQVLEEELTVQKMQQLMSHPIQMELMERQLKVLDLNERNFQSHIKKYVEKKAKQEKIKNEEEFQIQEDWDEYESD